MVYINNFLKLIILTKGVPIRYFLCFVNPC